MQYSFSLMRALLAFSLLWVAGDVVVAQTSYAAGACSLIPNSKTCIDATPCKTLTDGSYACLAGVPLPANAYPMTTSCWQYSYSYACTQPGTINTCTQYKSNPACSVVSSMCSNTIPATGQCDSWDYTYQCQTSPATTVTQTVCASGLFTNQPTPVNNNNSFTEAAIASEIIREGQSYNANGVIFGGVSESCTKGDFGIKECCSTAGGGMSNSAVSVLAFSAAASTVKYAGEKAIDWASPYVFDAMYNNGLWTDSMTLAFSQGASSVTNGTLGTSLSNGFSIGAYGFTYSTVNTAGQGVLSANQTLAGSPSSGYLEFNPYVFTAMVVLQIYQNLAACSQNEQMLSMHRGSHLSFFVQESCNSSFLGSCIEYTDTYCSFNSVLAKIINQQGKTQLGLSLSDCSGITVDQLSKIDFTKIDFSEFAGSVMSQATTNYPTNIPGDYTPVMENTTQGSSQGTSAVNPSY